MRLDSRTCCIHSDPLQGQRDAVSHSAAHAVRAPPRLAVTARTALPLVRNPPVSPFNLVYRGTGRGRTTSPRRRLRTRFPRSHYRRQLCVRAPRGPENRSLEWWSRSRDRRRRRRRRNGRRGSEGRQGSGQRRGRDRSVGRTSRPRRSNRRRRQESRQRQVSRSPLVLSHPWTYSTERVMSTRSHRRTIEIAAAVKNTFEPVLLLHLYPRSSIDIYLQILENDGCEFVDTACSSPRLRDCCSLATRRRRRTGSKEKVLRRGRRPAGSLASAEIRARRACGS